jgi:hypothetical protein
MDRLTLILEMSRVAGENNMVITDMTVDKYTFLQLIADLNRRGMNKTLIAPEDEVLLSTGNHTITIRRSK